MRYRPKGKPNWGGNLKTIAVIAGMLLGCGRVFGQDSAVWGEDLSYQGFITRNGAVWSADGQYIGFVTRPAAIKVDDDWKGRGVNRVR